MSWNDGAYEATSANFSLIIRIDLAGESSLQIVSCDLYQFNDFQFLQTFRSRTAPTIDGSRLSVDLIVPPANGKASLVIEQGAAGTLTATFQRLDGLGPPATPTVFQMEFKTPYQRQFLCELDREPEVPLPDSALIFSSSPPRRITWQECMQQARLNVLRSPGDGLLPSKPAWSKGEMLGALTDPNQNQGYNPNLTNHVYMMLVKSLVDEPDTLGLMFDTEGRRGAAVFYDAIRASFPITEEQRAVYVFSVSHELAHALNIPHPFDSGGFPPQGFAALTFTTYPQRYQGPGTPGQVFLAFNENTQRFWNQFDFRFAREELAELRHGNLFDILTGGNRYRGDDGAFRLPIRLRGDPRSPRRLSLELRLQPERPGNLFAFGEPVCVEVKLRALVDGVDVDPHLDPATNAIEFHIRRPDGGEFVFDPALDVTAAPTTCRLTGKRPSCFADICLSYSRAGFTFEHPGRYHVQALYQGLDGVLVSNSLSLFVRFPRSDEEEWVAPTFEREVNTYFAVDGSPLLKTANDVLDNLDRHFPAHPLARHHNALKAIMSTRGFLSIRRPAPRSNERMVKVEIAADPNPEIYAKALGTSIKSPKQKHFRDAPFSNILFEELARHACRAFSLQGEPTAKKLFKLARADLLEHRKIPLHRVLPLDDSLFWKASNPSES
jgi:hypothetical protein